MATKRELQELKALAKANGIKFKYDPEYGEFNVNGYMTECPNDAKQQIMFESSLKEER